MLNINILFRDEYSTTKIYFGYQIALKLSGLERVVFSQQSRMFSVLSNSRLLSTFLSEMSLLLNNISKHVLQRGSVNEVQTLNISNLVFQPSNLVFNYLFAPTRNLEVTKD